MSSDPARDFEAAVFAAVREAARPAIDSGRASLEKGTDGGGPHVRLRPRNPNACELKVYADYPTLCMGPEGNTTEMFGTEDERLAQLPLLVEAVIRGRFEWEHRQEKVLRLFPYTQLRGTFHTSEGPWTFTRQGAEPRGAVAHRTYEPY